MKPLYIILALFVGMYIGMLFESNQVKAVAPEPVQPDFELRLQSDRGFSTKRYEFVRNGHVLGHVQTRQRLRNGEMYTIIIVVPE
jgi:hypothetical protein